MPWDHQRTTAQHSTKQCHIASRSSTLPAPGPYPFLSPRVPSACRMQKQSLRREGALPFKALPLQCQRKGAFKGHFWLGRPSRPQIQNKNRSGAPDGLVSPAPQKGLIEPTGRAVGGTLGWTPSLGECAACGAHLGWDSVTGSQERLSHHWQSRVKDSPPG